MRKSHYTSEQLVKFYKLWSSDVSGDVIAWQTTIPKASQKFIGNAMSEYLKEGIISAHASLEMRDAIARIESERTKGGDKNMNTTNGITNRTFTKQGEPLKTNLDEKTPVIHKTYDYSKFKFLPENRPVGGRKAMAIMRSIEEDDQTPFLPVLVDANMGIIDGQHQFTACKKLGYPIYFVQSKSVSLRSIALLNQYMTKWGMSDYAHFYAKQGKRPYQELISLAEKNHLALPIALMVFSMNFINPTVERRMFKDGLFEITHQEEGLKMLDELAQFRGNLGKNVEGNRFFYQAYLILRNMVELDIWLKALAVKDWKIEVRGTKREYLRIFEDILNYNKQTKLVRLY